MEYTHKFFETTNAPKEAQASDGLVWDEVYLLFVHIYNGKGIWEVGRGKCLVKNWQK